MKIFIDTNVIMDVLVKREPFYEQSEKVWALAAEGLLEEYISAISVNNLFYILQKLTSRVKAFEFVEKVLHDFRIVPLTRNILFQTKQFTDNDFEDSIQYFSALHEGCESLITRNKNDFPLFFHPEVVGSNHQYRFIPVELQAFCSIHHCLHLRWKVVFYMGFYQAAGLIKN